MFHQRRREHIPTLSEEDKPSSVQVWINDKIRVMEKDIRQREKKWELINGEDRTLCHMNFSIYQFIKFIHPSICIILIIIYIISYQKKKKIIIYIYIIFNPEQSTSDYTSSIIFDRFQDLYNQIPLIWFSKLNHHFLLFNISNTI